MGTPHQESCAALLAKQHTGPGARQPACVHRVQLPCSTAAARQVHLTSTPSSEVHRRLTLHHLQPPGWCDAQRAQRGGIRQQQLLLSCGCILSTRARVGRGAVDQHDWAQLAALKRHAVRHTHAHGAVPAGLLPTAMHYQLSRLSDGVLRASKAASCAVEAAGADTPSTHTHPAWQLTGEGLLASRTMPMQEKPNVAAKCAL